MEEHIQLQQNFAPHQEHQERKMTSTSKLKDVLALELSLLLALDSG
jgi:hypothetical protein